MRSIFLAVVFTLVSFSNCYASPRYTAAKLAAEKVKKDEKDLKKKVKRLSAADKEKLKRRFRGQDSDSDGLPDILEDGLGSATCDSDSDDDGLNDSSDSAENNSDSDNDGNADGTEVEIKGNIVSFVDPTLVIGDRTFTITDSTVFRGAGFSKDDLEAGLCVEVEGHTTGSGLLADKLKRDDDC
jgi:hypothetical protein